MSGNNFWEKKVTNPVQVFEQPMVLDEEAVTAVFQGDPDLDLFEDGDDEEDTSLLMSDANLRLEQGRLYQMVLQGNIFADTNADPKAIRNVQREIHKYVRERMEVMLGIRQEQAAQETIVSSPFNDMEVQALKMLASKITKGETERVSQQPSGPQASPPTPKKDGITSISGSLRPQATTTPLRREAKPAQKPQVKQAARPSKSALAPPEPPPLQKPIEQMTNEELAAHNKAAEERSARNKAVTPNNLVPHPTEQQLHMMYASAAATSPISLSASRYRPYE